MKTFFRRKLLHWHNFDNLRKHPWTKESDPYKIWLSEIIMQQTQIAQGLPYYYKFIEQYPTVKDLAAAKDEDVFLLWEGLGYYNRCRNLLITARYISNELAGKFPQTYEGLLTLKGVGPYTAAAIASFAFKRPYAVLDGNVFRLLARFFNIDAPIDNSKVKKEFQAIADFLLPADKPDIFNQAIMDFGATICKAKQPLCDLCPLATKCAALKAGSVHRLPVKIKSIAVKKRHFHYLVLTYRQKIYLRQRTEKDVWQNLFEFYRIEGEKSVISTAEWKTLTPFIKQKALDIFKYRQRLTHQLIISRFHFVDLKKRPESLKTALWITKQDLRNYAFPKTILAFLNQMAKSESGQ